MTALRVLVVDDNADVVSSACVVLSLLGHVATGVSTGDAALTLLTHAMEADRPHVVLLDMGLPGISGYDVAERAGALPHRDTMTLIAVTGRSDKNSRQRALDAGCDVFAVKPLGLEELRALMNTAANTRR